MKYEKIIFIPLLLLLIILTSLFVFAQDVGYIQIKCEPGAMVLLNDNFVGNTSSEVGGLILQDVPAGSYMIKIVKEGFQPQSVRIDLKANEIYVYEVKEFIPKLDVKQAGESDSDTIRQKVGSLLIETIPVDCIIEIPGLNIDRDNYGDKTKKTWEISKIPVDSYQVNFIALGKKVEYNFNVEEGKQKHLLINILNNEVKEIIPLPKIGDTGPAGGIIFYDKGRYSDGWRYLEVAPQSTEWVDRRWATDKSGFASKYHGDIGTGQQNTNNILKWLKYFGEKGCAAQLCDAMIFGGYDDWFLPSLDELDLMYENLKKKGVGGFANDSYWSSSYDFAGCVYFLNFETGGHTRNTYQTAIYNRVRAVRSF